MPGHVIDVDTQNFEQVVAKSEKLVVVAFHAEWNMHCHAQAQVMEAVARDYADRLTVARIDVDKNPGLMKECGADQVPYLMFVRDGAVLARKPGQATRYAIDKAVEEAENRANPRVIRQRPRGPGM